MHPRHVGVNAGQGNVHRVVHKAVAHERDKQQAAALQQSPTFDTTSTVQGNQTTPLSPSVAPTWLASWLSKDRIP